MPLSPQSIAEAISHHRFEEAVPYLADDLIWSTPGSDTLTGKGAAIAACEGLAEHLKTVTATFRESRTYVADSGVVVSTLADYDDAAGIRTTVASCDLYDFAGEQLVRITSYNIEVPQPG